MIITLPANLIICLTWHLTLQAKADIDEGMRVQSRVSLASVDSTTCSTTRCYHYRDAVSNGSQYFPLIFRVLGQPLTNWSTFSLQRDALNDIAAPQMVDAISLCCYTGVAAGVCFISELGDVAEHREHCWFNLVLAVVRQYR